MKTNHNCTSGENGCIENFENTASYSRRYQASQDCMCDTEHMFDCPNPGAEPEAEDAIDALNDIEFNRFLQHSMQVINVNIICVLD